MDTETVYEVDEIDGVWTCLNHDQAMERKVHDPYGRERAIWHCTVEGCLSHWHEDDR